MILVFTSFALINFMTLCSKSKKMLLLCKRDHYILEMWSYDQPWASHKCRVRLTPWMIHSISLRWSYFEARNLVVELLLQPLSISIGFSWVIYIQILRSSCWILLLKVSSKLLDYCCVILLFCGCFRLIVFNINHSIYKNLSDNKPFNVITNKHETASS